jgi:hypothetical protein
VLRLTLMGLSSWAKFSRSYGTKFGVEVLTYPLTGHYCRMHCCRSMVVEWQGTDMRLLDPLMRVMTSAIIVLDFRRGSGALSKA